MTDGNQISQHPRPGAPGRSSAQIRADIDAQQRQLATSVDALRSRVTELTDWRKQVRDQDPDGEFVKRWIPELDPLPAEHLDRPEHAPLAVQAECGVEIGGEYPYPVVDFEAAREEFKRRYYDAAPAAAARLSQDEAARMAAALPLPKERPVVSPGGFTRRYGNTIRARIGVVRRDGLDACIYD